LVASFLNADDLNIDKFSNYSCVEKVRTNLDKIDRSIDEYAMGVVYAEINGYYDIDNKKSTEMFETMAITARTKLLYYLKHNGAKEKKFYDIPYRSDEFQAYNTDIFGLIGKSNPCALAIQTAVQNTTGQVLVFNSSIFNIHYFSYNDSGYTIDSEDSTEQNYRAMERRVVNLEDNDVIGDSQISTSLPGMSQAGAMTMALADKKYYEILNHYYGSTPPIVLRVSVYENLNDDGTNGTEKYRAEWTPLNGSRTLNTSNNSFVDAKNNISIIIKFDEAIDFNSVKVKLKNTETNNILETLPIKKDDTNLLPPTFVRVNVNSIMA
jgi:hypothetical protein